MLVGSLKSTRVLIAPPDGSKTLTRCPRASTLNRLWSLPHPRIVWRTAIIRPLAGSGMGFEISVFACPVAVMTSLVDRLMSRRLQFPNSTSTPLPIVTTAVLPKTPAGGCRPLKSPEISLGALLFCTKKFAQSPSQLGSLESARV